MVAAFTTAAVINHSELRPEDPVSPLDYMLNHRSHKSRAPEPTEEDEERDAEMSEYNTRVLIMAARMKAQAKAKQQKPEETVQDVG